MDAPDDGAFSLSRRQLLCGAAALGLGAVIHVPAAAAADLTPEAALERLRTGQARFAAGQPQAPQRDLVRLREVAEKQKPFAAVLGCADSRVPVEILYDQGFGDLFVVRVAGNIATAVEIASLEYGTRILGASALVVLGHSDCGAVKAALAGGEVPGQISTLYQHIAPALQRKTMSVDDAVKANVAYQARKLRKGSPVIARLIAEQKLALVGGVFDLASGAINPIAL
jgi:carbonic anhydrase